MQLSYYTDYIRNDLTAFGLLETELSDDAWSKIVEAAMQELLRYYDQTGFVHVEASSCIDLKKVEEDNKIKISSISNVYNTQVAGSLATTTYGSSDIYMDPMWLGFWQTGYGGRLTQWTYTYMNYINLNRIRQSISGAELDFREDKVHEKLYINMTTSTTGYLTLEYVPRIQTVEDVVGDYWVDILKRLSLAYAKIAVGRARTRFVQSGALWTDDGATILQEGTAELSALRERLQANNDQFYVVD